LLIDEDLFQKSMEFYDEFFSNKEEQKGFIIRILQLNNIKPRCMLNMVRRHVNLSDEIMELHQESDILGLFNLVVAIEAVYTLADSKLFKIDMLIDFFKNYTTKSDQDIIKKKFRLSLGDDITLIRKEEISLDEFARVIYALRCDYVHEGNYWNSSFNSISDTYLINILKVKLPEISKEAEERAFETILTLRDIRRIIVMGLIRLIRKYTASIAE